MPVQKRLTIAVLAMAVIVSAVAARDGSRSAGGADSYGYISQADRWLSGELVQRHAFATAEGNQAPVGRWVFSPLGWKPGPGSWDIVPTYAAGYPLMLAVAKKVAGHAAMFFVVPLMAGLLVWSTYLLGTRLGRPGAGALASALVATSSTVLYMSMAPMSDVPSAALWTLTLALVLGRARQSVFDAGAVCALAIIVRPNLAALGAFMGVWLLVNDWRARQRSSGGERAYVTRLWHGRALPFAALAAGGCLVTAVINYNWYGHATESGYGDLGGLFGLAFVPTNLVNYSRWLWQAETPLAIAGLVTVIVAPWFLNRRADLYGVPALLWLTVAWVWGGYLLYRPFEWWWYLRFLLPAWPLMAIGSACLISWAWQRRTGSRRLVVASRVALSALVVAAMSANLWFAWRHDTFRIGFTESRYPQVARGVMSLTDPSSAIFTLQHSGSVRYYGGRMTLRWDLVEPRDLGKLIDWLRARGHRPYLLVDAGEMDMLRARFPNDPVLAPLASWPLATFFRNETMLYDLDATEPAQSTALGVYTHRAVEPVAPPHWDR